MTAAPSPVAVVGASGKTGTHVTEALTARGVGWTARLIRRRAAGAGAAPAEAG